MSHRLIACLLILSLGCVTGCGGGGTSTTAFAGPTNADALADLAQLLKDFQQAQGRPPASLAALGGQDAANPAASAALARKEIVYFWGNGIAAGSTVVIAHDAKAASDGGAVLLQDGTVKTMSAAEFAAAPKAAKK